MFIYPDHDGLCAARSIIVCLAKLEGMNPIEFKNMNNRGKINGNNPNSQRNRAIRLQTAVGLPIGTPVSVRELHLFEEYLDVQIIVVSGDLCNEVCYTGALSRPKKIYLYLKQEHFHSILNVQALIRDKKLCTECFSWYGDRKRHSCVQVCFVCNKTIVFIHPLL